MSSLSPINHDRLAHIFTTLCQIDSPSRHEDKVAAFISNFFAPFPSVEIFVDSSNQQTASTTGNLIIQIPATDPEIAPLFFACHMDVISPCLGVKVDRHNDIFSSAGETVLGGDDKGGIAILLELFLILHDNKLRHGPLEFIFTTCEEIGLLGAKALSPQHLKARHGYALDSTGIDNVIMGAPAAVTISAHIHGRAAHAGLNPEDGLSAIFLASQVISNLPLGRLDNDSTANIGVINGGHAPNIIPASTQLNGEIRSHSSRKLTKYIKQFRDVFHSTMAPFAPIGHYELDINPQYPAMLLPQNSFTLQLCHAAAKQLHRPLDFLIAGGGSDANIFNDNGLETAILGIGMDNVHSTHETIALDSLVRSLELCLALTNPQNFG